MRALFDVARAAGQEPPFRIFGSAEFQRAVCEEARLRHIEVFADDPRIAGEHEKMIQEAFARQIAKREAEKAEILERLDAKRAAEVAAAREFTKEEERETDRRAPAPRPHI